MESGALAGFSGVVGYLSQGNAQYPGIYGDLGDKTVSTIIVFNSRTPQRLPVKNQLLQSVGPTLDLADHPGLQHLALASGFCEAVLRQVSHVEQEEEGNIRGPALEIQPQCQVQLLAVPFREGSQITGAPAVAKDPQQRHQQKEPLRIPHLAAVASVGDSLEEADQIGRCGVIS